MVALWCNRYILGSGFNQPIINAPLSTKKIVIKKHNDIGYTTFMQNLNYLPIGLKELYMYFNMHFNEPLNNLPNLKILHLVACKFNQSLNLFPDSLEEINIKCFDYNNTHKLPSNLTIFKIGVNKADVEDANNITFKNLRALQLKYPNTQFIYSTHN